MGTWKWACKRVGGMLRPALFSPFLKQVVSEQGHQGRWPGWSSKGSEALLDRQETCFLAFRDTEAGGRIFFSSSPAQLCLLWLHSFALTVVLVEERPGEPAGSAGLGLCLLPSLFQAAFYTTLTQNFWKRSFLPQQRIT